MKQVACVLCRSHNYFAPFHSWGCSQDVWLNMLKKETRYVHDKHFEVLHSELEPQMRSILLDWLLEVRSSNTNFLFCLYDGKTFRHKYAFHVPSWYIAYCQEPFWGATHCSWGYQNGKWLLDKSKIMRTQPLGPIQPKPNSEIVVSEYRCVLGTVPGAKDTQDEQNLTRFWILLCNVKNQD